MAFFKEGAETRVTDASPVGIGGLLKHTQGDGHYRSAHYVSRKLTLPEGKYF